MVINVSDNDYDIHVTLDVEENFKLSTPEQIAIKQDIDDGKREGTVNGIHWRQFRTRNPQFAYLEQSSADAAMSGPDNDLNQIIRDHVDTEWLTPEELVSRLNTPYENENNVLGIFTVVYRKEDED